MVSEITTLNHREVRRHGPRNPYREELSREGVREIKREAEIIYSDILREPLGSVFYIIPSDVRRARDTRKHLERGLKKLVRDNREQSIEFVSYKNTKKLEHIQGDDSKRWVIIDLPDVPEIGIAKGKNKIGEAWDRMQEDLRKKAMDRKEMERCVHELISRIGVTLPHELPMLFDELRKYTKGKLTNAELLELFDPRSFASETTPEEEAIVQLKAIHRETGLIEDTFPDQHVHGTIITHAPVTDYMAMGLLGMEITLVNWKKMGGIRNYLEPIEFQFDKKNDVVAVRFPRRGLESSKLIRIDEVIENLKNQAEKRREAWKDFKPTL